MRVCCTPWRELRSSSENMGKWYFPLGRPTTQVSRTHLFLTKTVHWHQHQTLTLIELARMCWFAEMDLLLLYIYLPSTKLSKPIAATACHCMQGLQQQYKGSRRPLSSSTGFSSKCWCTLQKVCFLEAAKGTLADSEMDTSVALIPAVNYASRILAQNSLSVL